MIIIVDDEKPEAANRPSESAGSGDEEEKPPDYLAPTVPPPIKPKPGMSLTSSMFLYIKQKQFLSSERHDKLPAVRVIKRETQGFLVCTDCAVVKMPRRQNKSLFKC